MLRGAFGITSGVGLEACNFSLVTTPPEKLTPPQRLPHFDTIDTGRIAVLHYLCRPEHGGTAFYRHRRTGFETVTADRFERYQRVLHEEAGEHGLPPARYFHGATTQFDAVAEYDAVFNRALIYRGATLHSGSIPAGFGFSGNPRLGRLTVNTFFQVKG